MSLIVGESSTQGYLGVLNPITGTTYDAAQTLVTNDAGQDKIVTQILLFNFHTSAVTANVYYLPNNGGAVRTPASEDDYKILEISVGVNDTEVFDIPMALNGTNDTIGVYASVASKVNAVAFGYEVS